MNASYSTTSSRRRSLATAGGAMLSTSALSYSQTKGANNTIRAALIGCGGRGRGLSKQAHGIAGVELVAVCDPDTAHMDKVAGQFKHKVEKIQDYRKLLERQDIDAVILASPNFWHALHTIHACQAGKDVYVEKPVSWDVWSGAQMHAVVEKTGRIVQAGTQNRSDKGLHAALKFIKEGGIGEVKSMYGNCFRNRASIGKVGKAITPPKTIDYDLWLGPSKDQPIMRPQLHYDWHWDFNTGNGDMGNQGPHELDVLAWFAGDPDMPSEIYSYGGRFGWNDAGNTANMQTAIFKLGGIPCTFEVNNMWQTPKKNAAVVYKGTRVGVIVTGEKGEFRGGRGGGYVVGPDGKTRTQKFPGDAGRGHMQNFFDCVRSRRADDLTAPIKHSHKSANLSHFANISMRASEEIPLEKIPAAVPQDDMLLDCIERQHAQLKEWNVDLTKVGCHVGTKVIIDPNTGMVSGNDAIKAFNETNYRKGYEIPKI